MPRARRIDDGHDRSAAYMNGPAGDRLVKQLRGAISAMGQWMLQAGYTHEQVIVYEAYLAAHRVGRDYVCLVWRKVD